MNKKNTTTSYVRVNNISESTLEKIDLMAEENGLSRNNFLKKSLENLVVSDGISELDSKFNELIKKNIGVLDLNTKVLKYFCEENLIDINHLIEN
ncbi:hypothetical protein [Terrisporobacter muris]|uniref:Uncharacterized protein n=1 Tax=Terrisporobacter muris TaxID=2963284 RepID=A0A9X2MFY7_9FIRM|nr:hypothetical protein [Terrisporobacter muris]MCR1825025.1 hypothetical protein [Terrisporobacter muris]